MRLNLFNVCIFVEMKIRIAFVNDIPKIVDVATKTWHNTYKNIISQEQIDFMFEKMYTANALLEQMQNGHTFLIYQLDNHYLLYQHQLLIQD